MSFIFEVLNKKEVKIVKYIGKKENLIIPSYTFIDNYAYKVTMVDKYALNNKFIKKLFIPESIKKIHLYAFVGFEECNIDEFLVHHNNKHYSSLHGNLYNKEKTILLKYSCKSKTEKFILPDSVKSIASSSFEKATYLKNIVLPNGLEVVEEYAFAFCTSLEKINLPSTLKEIKDYAFLNDDNLSFIKLPESLSFIGEGVFNSIRRPVFNVSVSSLNKAFKVYKGGLYSSDLKILYKYLSTTDNINLSANLEEIKSSAFAYLYLDEIKLPSKVNAIGEDCFKGSTLSKIYIPNGIKVIEKSTFEYCKYLKEVELPITLEEIKASAFNACPSLISISLPPNIKTIGESAFGNLKIKKMQI